MVGLKRTKSGLWAVRNVIPEDVRTAYGKREEKRAWPAELSAGQAKAEVAGWLAPIEERNAMLRAATQGGPVYLSHRQCRALAGDWYKQQVVRFEDDAGNPADWSDARIELQPDSPEESEAGLIKPTQWLIAERDSLLLEKGLQLGHPSAESLLQEMGAVWLDLCLLMERRASGDYGADPLEGTFPAFNQPSIWMADAIELLIDSLDYADNRAMPHNGREDSL